jgi:hypothetical protein
MATFQIVMVFVNSAVAIAGGAMAGMHIADREYGWAGAWLVVSALNFGAVMAA